jgi:hypothetical protein
MRRELTALGLLMILGSLFMACTQEQATGPAQETDEASQPDFSYGFPDCEQLFSLLRPEGKARALFRIGNGQVAAVSLVRRVRRAARYGNYDRASRLAWNLADLVNSKLPDGLVDPCGPWAPTTEQGAAALVNEVFELAGDPGATEPPLEIPEEAFLPSGGFGQIDPAVGGTILANNEEAALIADPTSFPDAEGPVTVAFYRLPDPPEGTPGDPIPGYQAYPEAYNFIGEIDPAGGVEFWMCVVEDALPVAFEDLVIGHDLGDGESELLTPPLRDYTNEILDCSNASYQGGAVLGSTASPWVQLAGRLLQPLADRLLDVEPLNAMYFGGKGLGGRGTSFSDFAPVLAGLTIEPSAATIEFSQSLQLNAVLPGSDLGNSDFTWTVEDLERLIEVTEDGIVTGIGVAASPGATSEVTASYEDYSATAQIEVVDLVCTDIPLPVIVFDRVETYGGFDYYYLSVSNWADYPDALFWMTNYYGPCGLNETPARTWVDIYEDDGPQLYGYCALDSASGLQSFSYALPEGSTPLDVRITIEDRACNLIAYSNVVSTE